MLSSVLCHVRVNASCDDGGLVRSEVVLDRGVMLILPPKAKPAMLFLVDEMTILTIIFGNLSQRRW